MEFLFLVSREIGNRTAPEKRGKGKDLMMRKMLLAVLVLAMAMFFLTSKPASAEIQLVAEVGQEVFEDGSRFQVGGNILLFWRPYPESFGVYDFVKKEFVYNSIDNRAQDETISPDGRFVAWSLGEDTLGWGYPDRHDIVVLDVAANELFAVTSTKSGYHNELPKIDAFGRLFWSERHDIEGGVRNTTICYLNLLTGEYEVVKKYSENWHASEAVADIVVSQKWLAVMYHSSSQNVIDVFSLSDFEKVRTIEIGDYWHVNQMTLAGDEVVYKDDSFGQVVFVGIVSGVQENVHYDYEVNKIQGMNDFLLTSQIDETQYPSKSYIYSGKYGGSNLINWNEDVDSWSLYANGSMFLYQTRIFSDDGDCILGPVKIFRDVEEDPTPEQPESELAPAPPPAVGVDVSSSGPCFIGATGSKSESQPETLPLLLVVVAMIGVLFVLRKEGKKGE